MYVPTQIHTDASKSRTPVRKQRETQEKAKNFCKKKK